jgi:hypothetical protein
MADLVKGITKLDVSGDGRTADNFNPYKIQLENALSAKEMQGLYLDDVLLNQEDGAEVADPGADADAWKQAAPSGVTRTDAEFATAKKAFQVWSRANRVAHSYIQATLPTMLHEEAAQRLKAHELWTYLEKRFAGQSLTSVAAMWVQLLQLRLDNFAGVSAFLTALTKLELEIKRAGSEVPPTLLAGAILNGMGDRFPTTKELLLTLPIAEQTKHVFGERLLEAERNAKISADIAMFTTISAANAATTKTGGCGYVRQRQGKGQNGAPGTKCTKGTHKRKDCWAFLDDQFLAANPDKGPGDLPNRLAELKAKQSKGRKPGASAVTTDDDACADVNVVSAKLNGLFFDYSGARQNEEVACSNTVVAASAQGHKSNDITVVLDSGASVSCLKEKINFRPLAVPIKVQGAGKGMTSNAEGTSTIPCPALPNGELNGIYCPDFRHNLVSVKGLQKKGVEVAFPANKNVAECRDPSTGKVLWTFKEGESGLYEAKVPRESDRVTTAVCTTCECEVHSLKHPSILLHYRLGHMSEKYMKTLIQNQSIDGLPKTFVPLPKELHLSCLPCIEAKTQAQPHPLQRTRARGPLEKIHLDLVGPKPTSLRGHRYWLTIVDDFSRHGWTILLHTKDQAKHKIIEWIAAVELASGCKVKHLHSDRGGEFVNNTLNQHLKEKGVRFTLSNPHSPEQNGVAEARNKSTGRILRALLRQSDAPHSLWGYAVQHATHLNNLFPHGLLGGRTPYEVWHQEAPSIKRLKPWGCTGHVLMNKAEMQKSGGKLGPVTKPCLLVGLNPSGPGWLLLDCTTHRELSSSDVLFQEDVPFYRRRADRDEEAPMDWVAFMEEGESWNSAPGASPFPPPASPPNQPIARQLPAIDENANKGALEEPTLQLPRQSGPVEEELVPEFQRLAIDEGEAAGAQGVRRSRRQQGLEPDNLPSSNVHWGAVASESPDLDLPKEIYALMQVIVKGESGDKRIEIPVPQTWQEALSGPHSEEWAESMVKEATGLRSTHTFEVVPRKEAKNIITCKWTFRVKRRNDGTPLFKSRTVARGFKQKKGVDYFDTWAPTAKQTTARVFFHVAAVKGMIVHAMDVDQAFLQGELEEEIYMEPPPGLPDTPGPEFVWKLKRPLYGLKQAPRQWHAKLKIALLQMGLKPSHSDPSLFIGDRENGSWILVYVDDLLLASTNEKDLQALKDQLKRVFPMKDLGEVSTYLGMEVSRDFNKRKVFLSQKTYISDILHKFGQDDCKPAPTPLQVNHGLNLPPKDEVADPDIERYPELLGSIMYVMVCTRPDIAHAVSVLSRFIAPGRHGNAHWKAALRLLSYLKGTADFRLELGGGSVTLQGHSDSSWADDQVDRRSSQGYCFDLGSGAISWKATRSPAVALSSCEAELYAGTSAAQEAIWLSHLLAELGIPHQCPMLWCDNESTVAMTKDPVFSARSKHIEARYFFIRELVQRKKINTAHIPGSENVADIFTKPLSQDDHIRLRTALGVMPLN